MSFRTARPACESSQHPCCDSRAFAAVLHVFEKRLFVGNCVRCGLTLTRHNALFLKFIQNLQNMGFWAPALSGSGRKEVHRSETPSSWNSCRLGKVYSNCESYGSSS
jgi:hypothetical protein